MAMLKLRRSVFSSFLQFESVPTPSRDVVASFSSVSASTQIAHGPRRSPPQIAVVKVVFRKIQKGKPMQQEDGLRIVTHAGKIDAAPPASTGGVDMEGGAIPKCEADPTVSSSKRRKVESEGQKGLLQRVSGLLSEAAGATGKQHTAPPPLSVELSPRQVLFSSTQDLHRFGFVPGDFRENICIEMLDDEQLLQQLPGVGSWSLNSSRFHSLAKSGLILQVGSECLFRLTFHCEPCAFVLRLLPNARKEAGRRIPTVSELVGFRGVLSTCVRGGVVRPGDKVTIATGQDEHDELLHSGANPCAPFGPAPVPSLDLESMLRYEALPNGVKGRALQILRTKVPHGKVLTIRDLLHYIGAPGGYARAVPAMLKFVLKNSTPGAADSDLAGLCRLVDSQGVLLERHLPGQRKKLEAEGVKVEERTLKVADLEKFRWRPTHEELFLSPRLAQHVSVREVSAV